MILSVVFFELLLVLLVLSLVFNRLSREGLPFLLSQGPSKEVCCVGFC